MKNIIIAILAVVVLVFAFLFFTQKKTSVNYEPWPETAPATVRPTTNSTTNNYYPVSGNSNSTPTTSTPVNNSQNTNGSASNSNTVACTPSITVTSPMSGAIYSVGQQVTITWSNCGVQNIWLGLVNGGKDMGKITSNSIPAASGSYVWTVPNSSWVQSGIHNGYQIVIESQSPNLVSKSGTFSIN
jgi:hypothetical protein